jgi:hypothetical protein
MMPDSMIRKRSDTGQPACKEQQVKRDLAINRWQERSVIERRSDRDKRKKKSTKYLKGGGRERRTGEERRDSEERRDRWMRVGKWRSESVFDESTTTCEAGGLDFRP